MTWSITPQGLPVLSWAAVKGARSYRVELLARQSDDSASDSGERVVERVIAEKVDQTWYSPSRESLSDFLVIDIERQGAIEDDVGHGWNQKAEAWWRPHDIGVVALGSVESEPGVVDGVEIAERIPWAIAPNATAYMSTPAGLDTDGALFYGTVSSLPELIAMTMADGSTSARNRLADLETITFGEATIAGARGPETVECAEIALTPLETTLEMTTRLCGPRVVGAKLTKGARKAITRANRAAEAAAEEGDLGEARIAYAKGAPTLAGEEEVARGIPEVDYPVFGSNALTKFIAANLLAGHPCMAMGPEQAVPGVDLEEAVTEAQYQNPYLLGVHLWVSDEAGEEFCIGGLPVASEAEASRRSLAALVEEVAEALGLADMSEYGAAVAIDGYLASRVEYDNGAYDPDRGVVENILAAADRPRSYNALGALEDFLAVCLGFAEAYQALAAKAGLTSVVVSGQADGEAHAWNKVMVDGKWRNVDSTWNSLGASVYLLLSDAELSALRAGGEDEGTWAPASLVEYFAAD